MTTFDSQHAQLLHGVTELIPDEQFADQLKKSIATNTPLNIKFGADPSRPDIHLGHVVILRKLRQFQDFGHHVQFIIGDFTAQIGDPTGKNKTRPPLSRDEILENAKSYQEQVFKILDREKTTVYFNSEWLNELQPLQLIPLLAQVTVQQLIARDDFTKRYKGNVPIFLHECLYPILQAYDSVQLKSDVECGGTDQKFNLLLGREFQKTAGLSPQAVLMMPILEGLDGVQKMSKSLDNYVGISDEPSDMFGKLMSIADDLMPRYYDLISDYPVDEITKIKQDIASGVLHPMDAKKQLAQNVVAQFYATEAQVARTKFEQQFSNREVPDDILSVQVPAGDVNVIEVIVAQGLSKSKNEARRLLKQGGLKLDNEKLTAETVSLKTEVVLKVGKRHYIKLCMEETS